jgi:hypothetical protein
MFVTYVEKSGDSSQFLGLIIFLNHFILAFLNSNFSFWHNFSSKEKAVTKKN